MGECRQCGECCSWLSWGERFMISIHTKTFMPYRVCMFLGVNYECTIYDDRPALCKAWQCGVFLKEKK